MVYDHINRPSTHPSRPLSHDWVILSLSTCQTQKWNCNKCCRGDIHTRYAQAIPYWGFATHQYLMRSRTGSVKHNDTILDTLTLYKEYIFLVFTTEIRWAQLRTLVASTLSILRKDLTPIFKSITGLIGEGQWAFSEKPLPELMASLIV